jgi:ABC-type uncharacterized transport system substrate-binding protein
MRNDAFIFLLSAAACASPTHKVFYVNSYHTGYAPSDQVEAVITQNLTSGDFELKKFHLDAKRLTEPELERRATEAWESIKIFKPDIVLVSDDNAIQNVVVPFYKDFDAPILFCGINWSAETYKLPKESVTGMLEVLPVEHCVSLIRKAGNAITAITVLSEKSLGEERNKAELVPLFESLGLRVRYVMVENFDTWKSEFKKSQKDSSVIFLPTNGAISGWDRDEAMDFVSKEGRIPSFTCDDFMIDYCAFGLMKISKEQGEWISEQARKVLKGASVKNIPITKNRLFECTLNDSLCDATGLKIKSTEFTCKSQTNVN